MKFADYVVLLAIAVCLAAALVYTIRRRKSGGCAGCSGCSSGGRSGGRSGGGSNSSDTGCCSSGGGSCESCSYNKKDCNSCSLCDNHVLKSTGKSNP